jgi:hypothetical protein
MPVPVFVGELGRWWGDQMSSYRLAARIKA